MRRCAAFAALALFVLLVPAVARAQGPITIPPNGDNQKASVTQHLGLVTVTIDYSSPDVHAPDGSDRRGKIWGGLVPYGMAPSNFGSCGSECPWRGGANENTVFTVSHDVEIEGKPLAAGSYGLHFIPGEERWTVIFSHDTTSWGSFFYEQSEDALRVEVEPRPSSYTEWLTYEFIDRQMGEATVALQWEDLEVPWTITVPDPTGVYMTRIRQELRSTPGFGWQAWAAAARFALANDRDLDEALGWAQNAVNRVFVGQANFTTLSTLAELQLATGDAPAAHETFQQALAHPTADAGTIHQYGRTLVNQGEPELAMRVFQANAENHPEVWFIDVGLARGHAALGHMPQAIEHAKKALAKAPDDANRQNLETLIQTWESAED